MSSIKIGGEERPLSGADSQWITQQINDRRRDGQSVCVVVVIKEMDIDVCLATPACGGGGGGGGGRRLTARETELVELWKRHGLNEADFAPGKVVAFVKQVLQRL